MTASRARPRRLMRTRTVPRPGPRVIVAVIVVLALGLGAWLWFRDSSLVSVKRVTITGVSGPDAARIRAALERSARNMTTLDVKTDQLDTAVGPYPVVKKLQVSTQFPHGMRIRVIEEIPVAEVQVGARTVAVAGDGTLLHDAGATPQLPMIVLGASPGGTRLTERDGLPIVSLLAAAPYQLLPHISQASMTGDHGLVAQLRDGPSLYFGDSGRLPAKWISATDVLASSGSAGSEYIDVSDPARPVAGASTSPSTGSSSTGSSTGSAAGSTPASGPSGGTSSTGSTAGTVSSTGG